MKKAYLGIELGSTRSVPKVSIRSPLSATADSSRRQAPGVAEKILSDILDIDK